MRSHRVLVLAVPVFLLAAFIACGDDDGAAPPGGGTPDATATADTGPTPTNDGGGDANVDAAKPVVTVTIVDYAGLGLIAEAAPTERRRSW